MSTIDDARREFREWDERRAEKFLGGATAGNKYLHRSLDRVCKCGRAFRTKSRHLLCLKCRLIRWIEQNPGRLCTTCSRVNNTKIGNTCDSCHSLKWQQIQRTEPELCERRNAKIKRLSLYDSKSKRRKHSAAIAAKCASPLPPLRACVNCGNSVNGHHRECRKCRDARLGKMLCSDGCGKMIEKTRTRCSPCARKRITSKSITCMECDRIAQSDGRCHAHYRKHLRARNPFVDQKFREGHNRRKAKRYDKLKATPEGVQKLREKWQRHNKRRRQAA